MRITWPWRRTPPAASAGLESLASTLPARAWREEALARAAEIQALSDWMDKRKEPRSEADARLAHAICGHVKAVEKAASGRRPWMHTSARLARATGNIHAAETDLLRRAPEDFFRGELPSMDAHVRRHLPVDDPRRVRIEDIARRDLDHKDDRGPLDPRDRESIIAAMRAASSAAAREQQRVRSFSAIISWASALLFVIAGLVALLGILHPSLLAVCFEPQPTATEPAMLVCPTGQSLLPNGKGSSAADIDVTVRRTVSKWDVPLIEIVGIVAAGVTGAIALRRIQGTPTPFTVPVVLNVLKLPTGALTAVLGLLLMRGGFVPGLTALDNTPQVIAWAVIFGASQQLFTGMVDRQAASVLDATGDKTYKATTG
jgi:hypothetical protein